VTRLLERERTALVVIDVQEGFRPAVGEFDAVARNAGLLVQGARILGLPVLVTEQYPRGLGETVPEVAEHLDGVPRLEKVEFDATDVEGFDLAERDQALLCGIEAHVCVAQTAAGLLDRGVRVLRGGLERLTVVGMGEQRHPARGRFGGAPGGRPGGGRTCGGAGGAGGVDGDRRGLGRHHGGRRAGMTTGGLRRHRGDGRLRHERRRGAWRGRRGLGR